MFEYEPGYELTLDELRRTTDTVCGNPALPLSLKGQALPELLETAISQNPTIESAQSKDRVRRVALQTHAIVTGDGNEYRNNLLEQDHQTNKAVLTACQWARDWELRPELTGTTHSFRPQELDWHRFRRELENEISSANSHFGGTHTILVSNSHNLNSQIDVAQYLKKEGEKLFAAIGKTWNKKESELVRAEGETAMIVGLHARAQKIPLGIPVGKQGDFGCNRADRFLKTVMPQGAMVRIDARYNEFSHASMPGARGWVRTTDIALMSRSQTSLGQILPVKYYCGSEPLFITVDGKSQTLLTGDRVYLDLETNKPLLPVRDQDGTLKFTDMLFENKDNVNTLFSSDVLTPEILLSRYAGTHIPYIEGSMDSTALIARVFATGDIQLPKDPDAIIEFVRNKTNQFVSVAPANLDTQLREGLHIAVASDGLLYLIAKKGTNLRIFTQTFSHKTKKGLTYPVGMNSVAKSNLGSKNFKTVRIAE